MKLPYIIEVKVKCFLDGLLIGVVVTVAVMAGMVFGV